VADFLKVHFDKLLLLAIIVYFSLLGLHAAHDLRDGKLSEAYIKNGDLFAGALLTLITGGRLMQRRVDTEGGNGSNGQPKSVTTTTMSTDQQIQQPASRASDLKSDAPLPVEVINKPEQPVPVTTEPEKEKKP
jgi:hypothetical protein